MKLIAPAAVLCAMALVLVTTPVHAEITARENEVVQNGIAVCRDAVMGAVPDIASHARRGDFTWNAEVGMWHWFLGTSQVALKLNGQGADAVCGVTIVLPGATDAEISNLALGLAMEGDYTFIPGEDESEMLIASNDSNAFIVRKFPLGWRIDFQP